MTPVVPRQRVIPFGAWVAAGIVFLLGFLALNFVFNVHENGVPVPIRLIVPIVFPLALAGYALLIGYVYGDARRRGSVSEPPPQSTGGPRTPAPPRSRNRPSGVAGGSAAMQDERRALAALRPTGNPRGQSIRRRAMNGRSSPPPPA